MNLDNPIIQERIENYFRVAGLWLKDAYKDNPGVMIVLTACAERGMSPQEAFNRLARHLFTTQAAGLKMLSNMQIIRL